MMTGASDLTNTKYAYLRQLPVGRLYELLYLMEVPASSLEEETYADALETTILEKEQKSPTGFLPDVGQQWAEFQEYYQVWDMEMPCPDVEIGREGGGRPVGWRALRRAAAAVALAACLMGGMVAAQAAGADVFDALARWTADTFSLGAVRSEGARDAQKEGADSGAHMEISEAQAPEYGSLQETLDASGVVEVAGPVGLPEELSLNEISVVANDDPESLSIYAIYLWEDGAAMQIVIKSYTEEPVMQVEKTDAPPELFEVGGVQVYLIENTDSCTAAWVTEHFECYISGPTEYKDAIREMAASAISQAEG